MDIDRYDLWSDRHDIAVGDLWGIYARYPHMPRLASRDVLHEAVSDGTSNMNWQSETFAYAEAHDGDTWVGIRKGEHVQAAVSGLLIHPDHVPAPKPVDGDGPTDERGDEETDGYTPGGGDKGPRIVSEKLPTSFYAQFDLDPVRGIKQLGEILQHVTAHLGSDVELHLEVRAEDTSGYDDATRRTVSENVTNLGGTGAEFE